MIHKGQFYRDTVNTDLLYVLGTYIEEDQEYVRCVSFTGGIKALGIIELNATLVTSVRFERVTGWRWLWYRLKFWRNIK